MNHTKKNVLCFIAILFTYSFYSQQKNTAEIKFEPAQDTLYVLEHNVLIVLSPDANKMKKAIFEVNGPALASDVPGKSNYFDVYPTAVGEIEITIRLKGKVLYNTKIKAMNPPSDPVKLGKLKMKLTEVDKMLKTK